MTIANSDEKKINYLVYTMMLLFFSILFMSAIWISKGILWSSIAFWLWGISLGLFSLAFFIIALNSKNILLNLIILTGTIYLNYSLTAEWFYGANNSAKNTAINSGLIPKSNLFTKPSQSEQFEKTRSDYIVKLTSAENDKDTVIEKLRGLGVKSQSDLKNHPNALVLSDNLIRLVSEINDYEKKIISLDVLILKSKALERQKSSNDITISKKENDDLEIEIRLQEEKSGLPLKDITPNDRAKIFDSTMSSTNNNIGQKQPANPYLGSSQPLKNSGGLIGIWVNEKDPAYKIEFTKEGSVLYTSKYGPEEVGGYTFKTNILTLSRINRAQNYIVEYLDSKTILFRFEKERTGSYNFISSIEGRWIKKYIWMMKHRIKYWISNFKNLKIC